MAALEEGGARSTLLQAISLLGRRSGKHSFSALPGKRQVCKACKHLFSWCRLTKLAGRHNVSKNWDTDSSSDEEEEDAEEEQVAETGSKGSMNRPAQPSSSRVQSDAETEHSTQRQRPRLQTERDSKAKRLLDGHKR